MTPLTRPSYHIEVYGCQMNTRDAESIEGMLKAAGYRKASGPGDAGVLLVVTCAVREHAETRALGRITQLAGARRGEKPVVVLCGCVAQEHGASLLESLPMVDLVVGPDGYSRLPLLLSRGARAVETPLGEPEGDDLPAVRRGFPRAFVTVTRGCDNFCSYCIVPYVRGRERSRPPEAILREVEGLAVEGFREITLLGQNVNTYGSGGTGFPELLARVARAADPAWVRFVTSHPRDLEPALADVMAREPNVCPALHLPVQAGSDRVLEGMHRGYTRRDYLDRIAMLREKVPGIVLSTDMIAGFPGETEDDFLQSLSLLEEVRFDYAFLFRYSVRKGTRAEGMDGAVPVQERLDRLHRLQELQNRITLEKSRELEGRTVTVLVTGPGKGRDQAQGRTPGNRVVVIPGCSAAPGAFLEVRITSARGWTHFGEPV